jgi:hypothetical protein
LNRNDILRALLRNMRRTIYEHAAGVEWYAEVARAQEMWAHGVALEEKEWYPKLEAYLQKAQLETLRDVCQSRDHPGIEEPKPATSHDFNYGSILPSSLLSPFFSPLLSPHLHYPLPSPLPN